jgi:hypothetical protein
MYPLAGEPAEATWVNRQRFKSSRFDPRLLSVMILPQVHLRNVLGAVEPRGSRQSRNSNMSAVRDTFKFKFQAVYSPP